MLMASPTVFCAKYSPYPSANGSTTIRSAPWASILLPRLAVLPTLKTRPASPDDIKSTVAIGIPLFKPRSRVVAQTASSFRANTTSSTFDISYPSLANASKKALVYSRPNPVAAKPPLAPQANPVVNPAAVPGPGTALPMAAPARPKVAIKEGMISRP